MDDVIAGGGDDHLAPDSFQFGTTKLAVIATEDVSSSLCPYSWLQDRWPLWLSSRGLSAECQPYLHTVRSD